ncbi:MAG: DNA cytosine methyltransferase [bacterium]
MLQIWQFIFFALMNRNSKTKQIGLFFKKAIKASKHPSFPKHTFYEFFAGGGMAKIGLGNEWTCLFANDWCPKKADVYLSNFPKENCFVCEDISKISSQQLPGRADLMWGSFPCQDLSLAGAGAGLKGARSGTYWAFMRLVKQLDAEKRAPNFIVLENVIGAITSHKGDDFAAIVKTITEAGYKIGALVADAALFLPQSRPRLFFVALRKECAIPPELEGFEPSDTWHPKNLRNAYQKLPQSIKENWIWWQMPDPPARQATFSDLIEQKPSDVDWHSHEETQRLINQMSYANILKLEKEQKRDRPVVGCIYRRTRNYNSAKVQRAEVRFDGISGCLRTPAGGSSRQILIFVKGKQIRSRLLSSREAARLMGVPDSYILPKKYNDAYHVMGDGLAVPVVSWLERNILRPLLITNLLAAKAA